MKASETYKLVEKSTSDVYGVEITSGPFTGTVYTYGKVSFRDKNLGVPVLKFQYNIESSRIPKKLLAEIPEFKNLIGDILHDMLELKYSLSNDRQLTAAVDDFIKSPT